MQNRKRDTDVQNRLLDSVGEGKGGMFWENGIDPVNPHIKLDTRSIIYKSTVILFSSVQLLRRVWLFVTPWTAACQGFPVHHQLLELSQTHGHWVGDAIQPSSVFPFSSCLQSYPTSGSFPMSQFFTSGLQSIGALVSFSISPFNDYSGLTSFRMDWLDLLEVQGILKSLLKHHSSKASILWHSAFLMFKLSHPYDYWKNHSFH